jgi:hypothetical protein
LDLDLDYILSHFQEPIWPRTISTRTLEGRQLLVNSREEALATFAQANYKDCRISAYPPNSTENPSAVEQFQGLTKVTPRNLVIIIDLDKCTFKSDKASQLALTKTLDNIKTILDPNLEPTIIWSGNGYHIYLVLDSNGVNLENVKQFTDLKVDQISLRFLRFSESYLSGGKSDRQHNITVSYNNSMMRIPGSINSKNNCEVKIIQRWNPIGKRPAINYLLSDFVGYLVNEKAHELIDTTKATAKYKTRINSNSNPSYINWIEQLIQTPMPEHRKFVVWMILPQYLINIRKMTHEQSNTIINNWLDECNILRRLDSVSIKQKLKEGFEAAQKGFGPIGRDKLRAWKPELVDILFTDTASS